jgi:hypothetical protein
MKARIGIGAVVGAMVMIGAGCSTSRVAKTWQSPNAKQEDFDKVLVVAVIPQEGMRRHLEDGLAAEFSQHGVTAVKSHQYLEEGQSITAEQLQEIAAGSGVDGVLVARYTGTKVDVDYRYSYDYGYRDYHRHLYHPAYPVPGWVELTETAYLDVRLFDAKEGGVLLWTASATTTDPEGAKTTTKIAKSIVDRLDKDIGISRLS